MKKSELAQLQIGSKVENKKSGDVITISNITEIDGKIKYELDNGHALAQATLSKNYTLVQPETVEQVELAIIPVEPKQVNVNTSNDLANEIFDYFTTQQNTFTLKHNTDHSVIKLGRKKLVEIYVSNTEVTVAVRQELYSEDEQANLDNSRIVKDYAFTLKFKVHSLDEFKAVVNRANDYVPVKK